MCLLMTINTQKLENGPGTELIEGFLQHESCLQHHQAPCLSRLHQLCRALGTIYDITLLGLHQKE